MKRLSIILVLVFCVACGNKVIEKPADLLSEKQMENIYYDLAIITAAKNAKSSVLSENNLITMPYIYAKYKIDSVQLAHSNQYYASDPSLYEKIYVGVQKRLEKERDEHQVITQKRSDSIKKAQQLRAEKLKNEKDKKKELKATLPDTLKK